MPPPLLHEALPGADKVPSAHFVLMLLPVQNEPAGHSVHEVRVLLSPPPVKEPRAHVLHSSAPSGLHFLSSFHGCRSRPPSQP